LKTIENVNERKSFTCTHVCPELTSLCPGSRAPDFYTLQIDYEPRDVLIELKSLKLYLQTFRERETYHEELANEVLDEFVRVVRPKWIQLCLRVNVRGGITTTVMREWTRTASTKTPHVRKKNP
jgi:7-cyano-7-deazaguanine reductase